MEQRNISILVGIALLVGLTIWINSVNLTYSFPSENDPAALTDSPPFWAQALFWQGETQRSIEIKQGLDLQGGLQVVMEADLAEDQDIDDGAIDAARIVVTNRVNGLGVTEPLVQRQGDRRLIVELPGVQDPELAIRTIRETGLLEFVDAGPAPVPPDTLITTSLGGPETIIATEPITDENGNVITNALASDLPVDDSQVYETIMTGGELAEVSNAGLNPTSRQVEINFSLNAEGADLFGDYTGANIGSFLCIVLDKRVISCPTVNARIDRDGTISLGDAGLEEGQSLAIQLRYGALPVPLKIVEDRRVGPTLGQDSVDRSIRAGTLGLTVVLLFMIVYYRLPGFMAALALVVYGLLNFSVYKTVPITLTLPAITGFILTVGMAVDANILVFERMKEELRSGRSLRVAVELGFSRAWPSIRDSAVSSIITCFILYWFGSNFGASIVKGFALTFGIGVVLNIFTAMIVTRALMRLMVATGGETLKGNPLLMGVRLDDSEQPTPAWAQTLFNIVDRRWLYYTMSGTFIAIGIAGMIFSIVQFGTPAKLSIDFTSGSLMELQFEEPVAPEQVRQIFDDFTYNDTQFNDTSVTTAEQLGRETILVRSKFLDDEAKAVVQDQIRAEVGAFTELRFDSVGPAIGQEVTRAGILAVIAAGIAILLFLMFAFQSVPNAMRYGVAAVLAMIHDILVTSGFFAIMGVLFNWEVDALFLTAILTVIGYSVHDTIIVFDRLRENQPARRTEAFTIVANRSVLETITRSVITSVSTLFVILAILVFGGATIDHFVAIIMVGIISGTYSSIFNAVPILVSWQTGEFGNLFRRLTGRPAEASAG